MPIDTNDRWIFSGYPGHFIGASDCLFHLTTYVNNGTWMVSTVGDYRPEYANGSTMTSLGTGGHYFETMVFACRCVHEQSLPEVIDWTEEESTWYSNHAEATNGHFQLCYKYQLIARE
jgi:hypothetical protein